MPDSAVFFKLFFCFSSFFHKKGKNSKFPRFPTITFHPTPKSKFPKIGNIPGKWQPCLTQALLPLDVEGDARPRRVLPILQPEMGKGGVLTTDTGSRPVPPGPVHWQREKNYLLCKTVDLIENNFIKKK